MEIEIASLVVILFVLVFLATIDTAFSRMSDVSLRRLASDAEDEGRTKSSALLRQIVEDRPRFRLVLSSAIQILLIVFTVILTLLIKAYVADDTRLLALALFVALAVTVSVRQIIPRLLMRNEPERKLLFLLPAASPLYSVTRILFPVSQSQQLKERQKIDITVAPDATDDRQDEGDELRSEIGQSCSWGACL